MQARNLGTGQSHCTQSYFSVSSLLPLNIECATLQLTLHTQDSPKLIVSHSEERWRETLPPHTPPRHTEPFGTQLQGGCAGQAGERSPAQHFSKAAV